MRKGTSITRENHEQVINEVVAMEIESSGIIKTTSISTFLRKWFE